MKKTSLASMVTGLVMVGASIFPNNAEALKQIELTKVNSPAYQDYNLTLQDRYGKTRQRPARFKARTLKDNSLTFHLVTGNYKRKYNFKERSIPVQFRYGIINPPDVYLIHPKGVKIRDIKQAAYIVPQNKSVELRPFKGSREELVVSGLRKLLETGAGIAGIPFPKEILNTTISYFRKKENESHANALEKLKGNYVLTKIPKYVTNKVVGNETLRLYQIYFDVSNLEGKIPMILWARLNIPYLAKGNKLEDVIVKFSLQGNMVKDPIKKKIIKTEEDNEKEICLYVNKKINSERNKCYFKHIDLNNDGRKESIVSHNFSASQVYTDVVGVESGKISHLFSYYGGATPKISKTRTKGYLDLFIVGQYRDKSVPSCVTPRDLPNVFNMIKWNGKKYKFSKEHRKQKYLGHETNESCSKIEIGKKMTVRSTFESKDKNAKIVFYKREGRGHNLSPWKEFALRKRRNGHIEYDSMVEMRNYSVEKRIIAETDVTLKTPSSFLEIKVGVSSRGYLSCETKPKKLDIKSRGKTLKLEGCSRLKRKN